MLESVEILKIIDILTRIEAILGSLVIFVLLLEFSVGAIVLRLVRRQLELYPESLTFHFLIRRFSVGGLLLVTSLGMVDIDVASV